MLYSKDNYLTGNFDFNFNEFNEQSGNTAILCRTPVSGAVNGVMIFQK